MKKKISGVIVPMVTPVNPDLSIDKPSAEKLVTYLVSRGTAPFVLGTTGEAASVPRAEKEKLVQAAVKAAEGKSTVYVGISGNAIGDVIEDAHRYQELGADVFVSTMATYYPADAGQVLRYFTMLADRLPGPLIIYNIPGTTHLSIPLEVVETLSRHPNIAGLKDSERSIERLEQSVLLWKDRADFSFLSGWAAQSHYAMELGADGIVPGTANLAPSLYAGICRSGDSLADKAACQEKADRLSEIWQKGRSLSYALPALKVMMNAYGLCRPEMLPPLFRLTEEEERSVRDDVLMQFPDLDRINNL